MNKVFLAGRVCGLDRFEALLRHEAAKEYFIERGFEVINPMELEHCIDIEVDFNAYVKVNIKSLMDCDTIGFLPCWQQCNGSILLFSLAQALNINVIFLTLDIYK